MKMLFSWLFILAVFGVAWQVAPAIFGIIATAVALAAFVALAAVGIIKARQ